MRFTGLMVPSAFETWAKAAILAARREQALEVREVHLAGVVDPAPRAGVAPFSPHSSCQGTMFEWCSSAGDQHLVPRAHLAAAVALRHQVDRLGGAAQQHDLAVRARAEKLADRAARLLVGVGGERREPVHAAVDVRVVALVDLALGVDHRARLLRARGRVEVDERVAVDRLAQHRELAAHRLDVEAHAAPPEGPAAAPSCEASQRCATARTASSGSRFSSSSAKARVSSPRASGSPIPRERR